MAILDHRVRTASSVTLEEAALYLLQDLHSRRLRVALVPAPDPGHRSHQIRCVEESNPAWYRQLCTEHLSRRSRPRRRKPKYVDTLIKRRNVLRALAEISRGGALTLNAQRVLPYVEARQDYLNDPDPSGYLEEEE